MAQAKTYIKSGNNLAQAEQLMATLLKDSTHRTNAKIWLLLFDAVKKQYDVLMQKDPSARETDCSGDDVRMGLRCVCFARVCVIAQRVVT